MHIQAITLITSEGEHCLNGTNLGLVGGIKEISPTQAFYVSGKLEAVAEASPPLTVCDGINGKYLNNAGINSTTVRAGQDVVIELNMLNPNNNDQFAKLFEIRVS